MKNTLKKHSGFTFLEIMIALAITGIVTAAIFKLFVTQHHNYMIQDDITEIQQNARASIDEVSKNIKMAGYALPDGLEPIEAYNTDPDTIVINYFENGCQTFLISDMPLPSSELKCGSSVTCYEDGQWVYIHDPNTKTGEWFKITQVQSGSNHLQHNTMSLSKAYPANAVIFAVTQVKYFIDNKTDVDNPKLMVQKKGKPAQIFADNINDLQFKYRMKNGLVLDAPIIVYNINEVQITVSGQSYWEDVDNKKSPKKNRTFATSVNPRNL